MPYHGDQTIYGGTAVFARSLGTLFKISLGVLISLSKQLLEQRPKTFISQSGMLAAAAVVAAPLLKLWDEMFWLVAPCRYVFIELSDVD